MQKYQQKIRPLFISLVKQCPGRGECLIYNFNYHNMTLEVHNISIRLHFSIFLFSFLRHFSTTHLPATSQYQSTYERDIAQSMARVPRVAKPLSTPLKIVAPEGMKRISRASAKPMPRNLHRPRNCLLYLRYFHMKDYLQFLLLYCFMSISFPQRGFLFHKNESHVPCYVLAMA